jgi:hypothetical protein
MAGWLSVKVLLTQPLYLSLVQEKRVHIPEFNWLVYPLQSLASEKYAPYSILFELALYSIRFFTCLLASEQEFDSSVIVIHGV